MARVLHRFRQPEFGLALRAAGFAAQQSDVGGIDLQREIALRARHDQHSNFDFLRQKRRGIDGVRQLGGGHFRRDFGNHRGNRFGGGLWFRGTFFRISRLFFRLALPVPECCFGKFRDFPRSLL